MLKDISELNTKLSLEFHFKMIYSHLQAADRVMQRDEPVVKRGLRQVGWFERDLQGRFVWEYDGDSLGNSRWFCDMIDMM